jgi:mRNA-degrading endonuclease RelE of RelBE toxin-antitoxin system
MLIIRPLTVLIFFFFQIPQGEAQQDGQPPSDPWQEITKAFAEGDASLLADYFNTMVDLGLPEKDNSYSKSQGEIVMKDFFKKSPPESFEILQKGKTTESSHHAICRYKSGDEVFRVSVFLQHEKDTFLITRIRFEKQ